MPSRKIIAIAAIALLAALGLSYGFGAGPAKRPASPTFEQGPGVRMGAAAPAAAAGTEGATTAAVLMHQALSRVGSEPAAALLHRAAASPTLPNLVAANSVRSLCTNHYTAALLRKHHPKVSERLLERASAIEGYCDLQGQEQQLFAQLSDVAKRLPADSIDALLAAPVIHRASDANRQRALRHALDSGSAPLLAYAAANFVSAAAMVQLGLPARSGIAPELDGLMFYWASRLMACQELGNCAAATQLGTSCMDSADCVDSLTDYPARYLYGDDTTGLVYRLHGRQASAELRRTRWLEIQAWIAQQLQKGAAGSARS